MSGRPVVFFHVMKCGGSSVRAALAEGVPGGRAGPGVFELDGRAAKAAAGGTTDDDWQFRDVLLPYVVATARPAVVLGHFRYRDRHAPLLDEAHLVTVLRDPVERLLSLYDYRRYQPGVVLPVSASLEDQLASQRWALEGHRYIDTFGGRDGLDPTSAEAVEATVENLRRFAVVGSVDRLDAFARDVSALLGTPVEIPRLNASPAPADRQVDADVLAQIRAMCAADSQVYERVVGTTE
ncbi:MAG: hypothetical protein ABL966_09705 [Acidimicrobiales bacterium]